MLRGILALVGLLPLACHPSPRREVERTLEDEVASLDYHELMDDRGFASSECRAGDPGEDGCEFQCGRETSYEEAAGGPCLVEADAARANGDLTRANKFYAHACANNVADACAELALSALAEGKPRVDVFTRDFSPYAVLWVACVRKSSARACRGASVFARHRDRPDHARALVEMSCMESGDRSLVGPTTCEELEAAEIATLEERAAEEADLVARRRARVEEWRLEDERRAIAAAEAPTTPEPTTTPAAPVYEVPRLEARAATFDPYLREKGYSRASSNVHLKFSTSWTITPSVKADTSYALLLLTVGAPDDARASLALGNETLAMERVDEVDGITSFLQWATIGHEGYVREEEGGLTVRYASSSNEAVILVVYEQDD